MSDEEVAWLLEQAIVFNQQWKTSQDQPALKAFSDLMRVSKDRCQLLVLKAASPEQLWVRVDTDSPNGEWLIGARALPTEAACHIPLQKLQQGLSEACLQQWSISCAHVALFYREG